MYIIIIVFPQSERIHRAAYESMWYNIKPQVTKDVALIMLRANKSLHLTAGKIFPLTMVTFCNVSYIGYNRCIVTYYLYISVFLSLRFLIVLYNLQYVTV